MTPEERIQRLEETQAFSERAVEELGNEIRDLGKRVAELAAALKKVKSLLTAEEDDE